MMRREKIKVYIYIRVSTAMQTEGYSLDAQKARMKAYADFNGYEMLANTRTPANPASPSRDAPPSCA